MKNRLIVFGLILVLAIVIGYTGFRLFDSKETETPVSLAQVESLPGRGFNRMAVYLDLDAQQREEFGMQEQLYRGQLSELTREMNELESEIIDEFTNANPDREKLFLYAYEIGILQEKIKQLTIDHFFTLREICTDEQAEKLSVLFKEIQEVPAFGRGRQGQGRGDQIRRRRRGNQNFRN